MSPLEASDECVLTEDCIDQYLWSVYERTRKVDTIKVQERIKATVKKNGKSRTVTKTVTKLVDEDFTWNGSAMFAQFTANPRLNCVSQTILSFYVAPLL